MHDVVYVVLGYALTALALGGYVALLLARARRARARVAAVASRRDVPAP